MSVVWQVFWRITFDVIAGVVRLQQELTWWELRHQDNNWTFTRRDRVVEDLPYSLVGAVTIERDRAVFRGGYLRGETLDLLAYARQRLDPPVDLGGVSSSLSNGENIAIRADVKLHPLGKGEYPIFYLPQPSAPAGVRLLEEVDGDDIRWISWHISNQDLKSQPFRLAHFDGWHALRVRQDEDTAKGTSIYEFVADSIPLGDETAAPSVHKFDTGSQVFFIGATPDHPDGLHGEIYHLDFDPNDSCVRCRKVRDNPTSQTPIG